MNKIESSGIGMFRGLVILYIVTVTHMDDYLDGIFDTPLDVVAVSAGLGWLFFASGYTLNSIYPEVFSLKDALSFIKKRFIRLFPLFSIAAILFYFFIQNDLSVFLQTLTFVNIITGQSMLTLWFVPVVFFFYIVFAVSKLVPLKLKPFMFVILFIVLALMWYSYKLIEVRAVVYLPVFIFGTYCASNVKLKSIIMNEAIVFTCFIGLILLVVFEHNMTVKEYIMRLLSSVFCAPLLLYLSNNIKLGFSGLNLFKYLSYASYVMYLTHRLVYSPISGLIVDQRMEVKALILYGFGLPIIIIGSYIVQKQYDNMLKRLSSI